MPHLERQQDLYALERSRRRRNRAEYQQAMNREHTSALRDLISNGHSLLDVASRLIRWGEVDPRYAPEVSAVLPALAASHHEQTSTLFGLYYVSSGRHKRRRLGVPDNAPDSEETDTD
jgi:hypothetical protein